MSGTPEPMIGELLVTARLTLGAERLRLIFTNQRIIVSRVGKRGAGELAAASLLGRFSAAFEELFRGGRESLRNRRAKDFSPEEILQLDRDNFQVRYVDVVDVSIDGGTSPGTITLLTKDDKLVFETVEKFESIVRVFSQTLGQKVRTSHRTNLRLVRRQRKSDR